MIDFSHLHGHSYFSNILQPDALCSPEEIVERAKELGLKSICITDHASVSGVPSFVKACKAAGIKPIVGSELYVCINPLKIPAKGERDYAHVVALAMNWDGFEELLALLSKANTAERFHYRPRNSFEELSHTKHLIFLTACAGGVLKLDEHEGILEMLKRTVGPDRLYLEIQPHDDDGQRLVNARAIAMRDKLGLKLVATQDFHYAKPGQNVAHEVLLAVGTGKLWNDPTRLRYPVDDLYVKSGEEMMQAFKPWIVSGALTVDHVVEAFKTANEIASRIDFQWREQAISLPQLWKDPEKELMTLCVDALQAKGLMNPEYVARLQHEFKTIKDAGILVYFLVLRDIISWCRSKGIMVGPARGSSGGSLICYLIGITQIDPIKHGLLFERFYRPGRVDLPDIDTDFEDERREEVIAYIRNRFGDDCVSGVSTYMMLGAKSAIRSVARVFGVDFSEINQILAPVDDGLDVDEVFENPSVKTLFARVPHIETYARQLVGCMRGVGQHAAGVVVSGVPIVKRAVVSRRDERAVANWDKDVIEGLGLMKLDVLGLRTLSILRNARENVLRSRGFKIDYTSIPLDDAKTLALFDEGRTTGVFQFESPGMRKLLKSLRVDRFSVIADANALYRPGPMDLLPQYTMAQTGVVPPSYMHPALEPILKDTYGILIYQEQLMRVFSDLAGFSYAEADKMRKIVGKRLGPDEFRKHEGDFVAGCARNGIDEATARSIFNHMVSFAGYGFNKSHAVAYSIIAFWCAYMKAHHTADFLAAHLSNSDAEQSQLAVDEARELGVRLQMPDVNRSDATRFTPLNETTILAPLSAVHGVGEKAASLIVKARKGEIDANGLGMFDVRIDPKTGAQKVFDASNVRNAPFADHKDFLKRIPKRVCNIGVQTKLREVGALPWAMPDETTLFLKRKELLGQIYREAASVDPSAYIDMALIQDQLTRQVWMPIQSMTPPKGSRPVVPTFGSKPRVMLIFDAPEWHDSNVGSMGNGKSFEFVRKLFKDELGMTMRDFYVTAFHRFKKPPLGYEAWDAEFERLLNAEIDLVKPPAIVAFGKRLAEFFAGKGASVKALHCRTVFRGTTPVLISTSPYTALAEDATAENIAEFRKIAVALGDLYK